MLRAIAALDASSVSMATFADSLAPLLLPLLNETTAATAPQPLRTAALACFPAVRFSAADPTHEMARHVGVSSVAFSEGKQRDLSVCL